jgi:glycosyltransferase involved in cell wall biosynthesis
VSSKPRLLFISPRFLLPADSGGKIRTGDVLRGLKGGFFEVTLASPAPPQLSDTFRAELAQLCDRFVSWPEPPAGTRAPLRRLMSLASDLPSSVVTDRSGAGEAVLRREIATHPDTVVVDFVHAAVLLPEGPPPASVLFTHNVEAEIFARRAEIAPNPLERWVWRDQQRKMERFERAILPRYRSVVAVSERDKALFRTNYGVASVEVIPTGIDLARFEFAPCGSEPIVVFTGSMDSLSNVDGVAYFMDEVWPIIGAARPDARAMIVGRHPPDNLVEAARRRQLPWSFTGFVDDVRPHIRSACVSVIPLRVGSGTRMKAFEAMAMGSPVVSTTLGVEGLPVEAGTHLLVGDTPDAFAASVLRLLGDATERTRMAAAARHLAERNSATAVAETFEAICRAVLIDKAAA